MIDANGETETKYGYQKSAFRLIAARGEGFEKNIRMGN
jgi:hypothetical protein